MAMYLMLIIIRWDENVYQMKKEEEEKKTLSAIVLETSWCITRQHIWFHKIVIQFQND